MSVRRRRRVSRAVGILFPTHPRPEACGRSTSPKQPLRRTAARGRAVWRLASRDDGREKKLLADTGVALAFLRGCAGVHRPGRVDSYFVSVSDNTTRNSNGWPRMELRSARRANARLAALGISNHLRLRARRPLHPAHRLSLHRRTPPLVCADVWVTTPYCRRPGSPEG